MKDEVKKLSNYNSFSIIFYLCSSHSHITICFIGLNKVWKTRKQTEGLLDL